MEYVEGDINPFNVLTPKTLLLLFAFTLFRFAVT